ncbi:hypothetical protein B7463_g10284, partial [Scytalidium lignicola]
MHKILNRSQYPFELAKTRLQLRSDARGTRNPLVLIRQIVVSEGIGSLYTGCSVLVLGTICKASVRFLTFDYIKNALADDKGRLSTSKGILAGMAAGCVESVVAVTPTERIKTTLIDDARGPNRLGGNFLRASRMIVAEQGFLGLYRGLVPTTMKQSATVAVRMGSYNGIKEGCKHRNIPINGTTAFLMGATAGTITVYATQPFDTIKTRAQSTGGERLGQAVVELFREEGIRTFWKGSTMQLGRLMLSGGIVFSVRRKYLRDSPRPRDDAQERAELVQVISHNLVGRRGIFLTTARNMPLKSLPLRLRRQWRHFPGVVNSYGQRLSLATVQSPNLDTPAMSRFEPDRYIDYEKLDRNIQIARDHLRRPLTYAEKVIYGHLDKPETARDIVRGQSYVKVRPSRVALQDISGQMALLQFMTANLDTVTIPTTLHCDHLIIGNKGHSVDLPKSVKESKEVFDFLRNACSKYSIGFWKPGSGIIHQVVLENYAYPGGLMLGTDSHTPNAGGLGMGAIGVGGADAVDVMAGLAWELKLQKS